jgi:hypothetical protein
MPDGMWLERVYRFMVGEFLVGRFQKNPGMKQREGREGWRREEKKNGGPVR